MAKTKRIRGAETVSANTEPVSTDAETVSTDTETVLTDAETVSTDVETVSTNIETVSTEVETVPIEAVMRITCHKGIIVNVDLRSMAGPADRARLMARGIRTLLNDRTGASGMSDRQAVAQRAIDSWMRSPEGAVRGESNPLLVEVRRVMVQSGLVRASVAKDMTEVKMQEAAGAAWEAVVDMATQRLADANGLRARIRETKVT